MARKKIVFVGGGSYGWMPRIVKDMLLTESISGSEYVLYDINKTASDLVARFLEKLNRVVGTPLSRWRTGCSPRLRDAVLIPA